MGLCESVFNVYFRFVLDMKLQTVLALIACLNRQDISFEAHSTRMLGTFNVSEGLSMMQLYF